MLTDGSAPRCGVLGHPIAHSLSPLLHRTAYTELGLDWTYGAYDVSVDTLPDFIAGLDDTWRGLSLTMPLKRAVLPLLDELDDTVRAVGAANTVVLGRGRRVGANTDVPGLVAALRGADGDASYRTAVVVGAGATAASSLVAMAELGVQSVEVRGRDASRAEQTVDVGRRSGLEVDFCYLDATWPDPVDLLVSTVPSEVTASVPDAVLSRVVADVGYDPWPSPLLARADRLGARTATGLDLLVHQAAAQVLLMCGRPVDTASLFAAGLAAIQRRVNWPARS